jgi:hypothetical protein
MNTKVNLVEHQVFLNHPFEDAFDPLANAMHFAIVASNLIPICAKDLSSPDRPRLDMLVSSIINCQYSIHDFSKLKGEGEQNFARLNMSLEMGMALFHALQTQRVQHRCAFFVSTPHDYRIAASDLAGLDPIFYDGNDLSLVAGVYEWLRDVVRNPLTTPLPTNDIKERYNDFKIRTEKVAGSGKNGHLSHNESQELMFQICSEHKLWDWRENKAGQIAFPEVPLSWKQWNI